ncbi:site-specific DNA-methyltransferase [Candidatus Acetothermia bacterium]|jgi:site-specific DNA-methyltransferase (cytosine-N4-specific)|nr:site-specific DNA-methyltransferase [Candidatus Acetothermia bacterium]MCI2432384.1 site-specific DNA-methyltransferase [Candidatus Acetothermia bacterium]MCI2437228.1 site-specific DNA-methyltransferase [Candidatus Acetothermia bacterium]
MSEVAQIAYKTSQGVMLCGYAESTLVSRFARKYRKRVQSILTSPPFPLDRKKKYGNLQGEAYIKWLATFSPLLRDFLKPDGSIVLELGNAWEPGEPVMSTLTPLVLSDFKRFANINDSIVLLAALIDKNLTYA